MHGSLILSYFVSLTFIRQPIRLQRMNTFVLKEYPNCVTTIILYKRLDRTCSIVEKLKPTAATWKRPPEEYSGVTASGDFSLKFNEGNIL